MSRLRDGMRRTVLVGASVLREASAGVLDAVAELAAPQIRSASLERELELARQQGRWLSDDERADLLVREQGRAKRRRTLLLLAALSLLIPLFWPLLPLWLGLIWWPVTTRRLLMVLLGTAVTGLSLLLDNVTTVVIFGPLIILIARAMKVTPIPFLMAAALLSDTGGVATLARGGRGPGGHHAADECHPPGLCSRT